jgi:hypothetical protein
MKEKIDIDLLFLLKIIFVCIITVTMLYVIFLGVLYPKKLSYYPDFISAYEKTPALVILTWLCILIGLLLNYFKKNN